MRARSRRWAVELSDAVQLVVVRGLPVRVDRPVPSRPRPAGRSPEGRTRRRRNPLRELVGHIVDAGQLRLAVRAGKDDPLSQGRIVAGLVVAGATAPPARRLRRHQAGRRSWRARHRPSPLPKAVAVGGLSSLAAKAATRIDTTISPAAYQRRSSRRRSASTSRGNRRRAGITHGSPRSASITPARALRSITAWTRVRSVHRAATPMGRRSQADQSSLRICSRRRPRGSRRGDGRW
jgi:hypothetical protein